MLIAGKFRLLLLIRLKLLRTRAGGGTALELSVLRVAVSMLAERSAYTLSALEKSSSAPIGSASAVLSSAAGVTDCDVDDGAELSSALPQAVAVVASITAATATAIRRFIKELGYCASAQ
ncbi:MAG: hypothetical protein OXE04_05830 [bacterium]|nr:hypothetical protein [bacterium]